MEDSSKIAVIIIIIILVSIILIFLFVGVRKPLFDGKCDTSVDCQKGFVCRQESHTCVECVNDDNCSGNINKKLCDTSVGRCTECGCDNDCVGDRVCRQGVCVTP